MDKVGEDALSHICELILQEKVDELRKVQWEDLIKETIEIPVQLIKLHVPDVKVICSIQGEDLRLPLLHIAAASNCTESIKCLLDMGYEIDHQSSFTKSAALLYAAFNDHLDCVKYLLDRNCDVNKTTEFYDNHICACNPCDDNSNIINTCDMNKTISTQSLCAKNDGENDNNINDHESNDEVLNKRERFSMTGGVTALVLGASHQKIVFELILRGAKTDAICEYDRGAMHLTALGAAINAASPESAKLLLHAGISLGDICEFNHNHSALDMAICCCKYPNDAQCAENMYKLVDLLISYGADPNLITHDKTLLQNLVVADRSVDINIMKKLHNAGADKEQRCKANGHTVLSLSILHGRPEQVKMFLIENCKLNYQITLDKSDYFIPQENSSSTPIELALYLCEKDIDWAKSVRSWDPNFFLFLTRQLSITEMLPISGAKLPPDIHLKFKHHCTQLTQFRHSEKVEVKELCDRIHQLHLEMINPLTLEDLTANIIRSILSERHSRSEIYNLGLPKLLVERCFVKRLESIPLPQRKCGLLP